MKHVKDNVIIRCVQYHKYGYILFFLFHQMPDIIEGKLHKKRLPPDRDSRLVLLYDCLFMVGKRL
jgi:hypothetical protein